MKVIVNAFLRKLSPEVDQLADVHRGLRLRLPYSEGRVKLFAEPLEGGEGAFQQRAVDGERDPLRGDDSRLDSVVHFIDVSPARQVQRTIILMRRQLPVSNICILHESIFL